MKHLFLACLLLSLNALAEIPIHSLGSFDTVQSSDGEHCHGYNIDLWQKSDTEIFGLLSHHAGPVSYTHLDVYKRQHLRYFYLIFYIIFIITI